MAKQPVTQVWINRAIENPLVLYPLLATMVLATLAVVLLGSGNLARKESQKALASNPPPVVQTKIAETPKKAEPEQPAEETKASPEPALVEPTLVARPPVVAIPVVTPPVEPTPVAQQEPVQDKPKPVQTAQTKPVSIEESLGLRAIGNGKFAAVKLDAHAPLVFARFEPGDFRFGVPPADLQAGEIVSQSCRIEVPYYLSTTEVTNRQYEAFARAVGDLAAGVQWRGAYNADPEKGDYPVAHVSLEQARAFCKWLGGRLPTERQWERAARGAQGRATPWEAGPVDATRCRLRFGDDSTLVKVTDLAEGVGPDGLVHLLGNVAEWCDDVYQAGHQEGPGDPGVNRWNVVRGGSYLDPPPRARITTRTNCPPEGAGHVGFRVAIPLPLEP